MPGPATTRKPYGTWPSPISASLAAEAGIRMTQPMLDGDVPYWLERRPAEGGRYAIVRHEGPGRTVDVTPSTANARSRVHEYGGGAATVRDGVVYYVEHADQRLYCLDSGRDPEPVTPDGPWTYADPVVHPSGDWLVAVREEHGQAGREPLNTLVLIRPASPSSPVTVIQAGSDFYGCPRISADGGSLCWIAWHHPQMPWDGTELWTAAIDDAGRLTDRRLVAGGACESIFQPGWMPDGTLVFVSDRTGWWNLHREAGDLIVAIHPREAEFGRPYWQFGMSTWAPAGEGRLVAAWCRDAAWRLSTIDLVSGERSDLAPGIEPGQSLVATATHALCVGRSAVAPDAVVRVDLDSGAIERLRTTAVVAIDPAGLSRPRSISFPTDDGETAHALFYPPANTDIIAPTTERPPLIVVSHGGPTGAATATLDLEYQFWTSRGFAIVDVNYRGSTSYGRAYREKLNGLWGIADVADCVHAADYLVREGAVDRERLIIRGESAGGYTTLAALAFRPDVFRAGASYFGVSDLEALARDTHKFESRYLDSLVGPYPEAGELYRARSPIHAVEDLACPLILFQGAEDRVVPPDQARLMAEAVRAKGLPVSLQVFEGEQHGFRRQSTIRRCLESELAFYGMVFGFTPADPLPALTIDNPPDGRHG